MKVSRQTRTVVLVTYMLIVITHWLYVIVIGFTQYLPRKGFTLDFFGAAIIFIVIAVVLEVKDNK